MIKKEETKLSLFIDGIQLTLEQQGMVKGVKGGGSTSTQWDVSSLYPWFLICTFNQLWIMPYYSMYLLKKESMCKWTCTLQIPVVQRSTVILHRKPESPQIKYKI